ncbi:aromatic hydrocarbon degradation protein [Rhodospirillum rubrum F11]|uniref:Membrane protein involved in aromatic hydrocarbon degradation n=1 Tax=Rhodospirillum rubrum (strain ATCC 11170 / ATH 1.1.1 / DSM 467 / LMG 4362 / NCIMB 8255 / S1) TaxID=269796 RepID=Q2RUT1_RHORT|nr:outer membrane protein transport protein [Rhodospirillum rubrum]ABC22114.1 Membrane protein involved in aromatic hydrocarbon degradation [Rhodospirillum rubrum ATCC 11170]AEO47828.1 aromatic hydrocarbon degradation protein [Rhodospirillum rubrum F11]MBK5953703.1 aromatic hydrocarbon degradation protein [Rhodospirillum rubrum]QXG81764.1 outer membrane protein transport protein [Rhodospirillum rubrum]
MTIIRTSGAVAGLCGLAVALSGGSAWASGFQLKEQSAEGLGNAFAGATAKAYDPSTAFYNPAGLTRLKGTQADSVLTYIMPKAHFSGSGTNALGGSTGSIEGGDAVADAAVPSFYGVYSYNDDLKFGIAANVPFGLRTDYDKNWAGRYQAIESDLQIVTLTPSVAYRVVGDSSFGDFSIGGGPVVQFASVKLTNAVNNFGLVAGDGRAKVSGSDIGYGFNIGALWEPTETTRIGVNYRSRVEHNFDGDAKYTNVARPLAISRGLVNSGASADLTTPDVVSIGAYHEFDPQWAVTADVAWTNWSLFDELKIENDKGGVITRVDESWEDTMFVALGGIYKPVEDVALRIGVAYDQAPVGKKHRTARIPDTNRYWLAAGVSYAVTDSFSLDASYAHIFADRVSINETTAQGNLTGTYDSSIDILSASATLRF